MKKLDVLSVVEILETKYKGENTALNYTNNFELLVAVILSAQCTDERVNKVTPALFSKYNTAEKMSKISFD